MIAPRREIIAPGQDGTVKQRVQHPPRGEQIIK
jgi:hypothetical protein